jgi:hypothetical protein
MLLRTMLEAVNVVARGTASLSKLIEPLMVYSSSGEINLRVSNIQDTLSKLEMVSPAAPKNISMVSLSILMTGGFLPVAHKQNQS